jgi:hypothetical protein
MWKLTTILIITFWIHSLNNVSFEKKQFLFCENVTHCKTQIDSLTKKTIYITVDKEAINSGGQIALMRQYEKITLDSFSNNLDTKFIIAFVVDADGQISGERILKDQTDYVGQRMIRIAKSFKWTPAECDGLKVPMLVRLPLQICLQQN